MDYVFETVLMSPTGMAFAFTHQGHVEGTVAGLPFGAPDRNDDGIQPGNNPALANQFEDLVDAVFLGHIAGKDTLPGGVEDFINDTLKEAATDRKGSSSRRGAVTLRMGGDPATA